LPEAAFGQLPLGLCWMSSQMSKVLELLEVLAFFATFVSVAIHHYENVHQPQLAL